MSHFVTQICTHARISVTKWCIVGYGAGTLWDLCNRCTAGSYNVLHHSLWHLYYSINLGVNVWRPCIWLSFTGRKMSCDKLINACNGVTNSTLGWTLKQFAFQSHIKQLAFPMHTLFSMNSVSGFVLYIELLNCWYYPTSIVDGAIQNKIFFKWQYISREFNLRACRIYQQVVINCQSRRCIQ